MAGMVVDRKRNRLHTMSTPSSGFPTTSRTNSPPLFNKKDFTFFPQICSILSKLEKRENIAEIVKEVSILNQSFQKCQIVLEQLPGVDLSREQQEQLLERETKLLEVKRKQLEAYLNLPVITNSQSVSDMSLS